MSRLNLTVLSEHLSQTVVVGALRQTLDEQVEEAAVRLRTLLLSLMIQNLDLLAVEFERAALLNSLVGVLLSLKLNVAEATGLAVGEEFKLAGTDRAKLSERVVELLLSHASVNELHDQVGLGLHEVTFLQVAADKVLSDLSVV